MTGAEGLDMDALLTLRGIPEGPAGIHFCPVPGCGDLWESEPTCEHAVALLDHVRALEQENAGLRRSIGAICDVIVHGLETGTSNPEMIHDLLRAVLGEHGGAEGLVAAPEGDSGGLRGDWTDGGEG